MKTKQQMVALRKDALEYTGFNTVAELLADIKRVNGGYNPSQKVVSSYEATKYYIEGATMRFADVDIENFLESLSIKPLDNPLRQYIRHTHSALTTLPNGNMGELD